MEPLTAAELKRKRGLRHTLPKVGFFSGGFPDDPAWPTAESQVDETWPIEERERVLTYLEAHPIIASYRGSSTCRLCGIRNGSQERSDGKHVWPTGYAHYVRDHGVKPPEAFLTSILSE